MAFKSEDLIERFKELDTTCISDALDRLGIRGGCQGILPQVPGTKAVGRAFTVRYRPCGIDKGTVGDFLEDVEPGQIVVLDNGGRIYGTVWGDIMTVYAMKHGISGTVIDGVCRDLPKILELKYPIFSRGRFMVTGKDRVEVDAINVPVSIADILVKPGDIVVGDDTGVVIVPFERAEEVLKIAKEIDEVEKKIIELIEKGISLKEARQQTGYHRLQSKREN
jgi:regulator of RNase E activity RraA